MSASEIAYFSVNPADVPGVQNDQATSDSLIKRVLVHPELLLASILITGHIVNVSIVILCTFVFYSLLDFSFAPVAGVLLLLATITLLILLAEIVPRRYARMYPLRLARLLAPMMIAINYLCYPLSKLLVASTSYVQKKLAKRHPELVVNELSTAFDLATPRMSEDKDMIKEVIKFYNKTADDIMTSRVDMEDIDCKSGYREVVNFVLESGYSRIPVYEDSEDNMKGLLYLRDLLPHLDKGDNFDWKVLIRPAYFVPETKKIDDLLQEFRTNKVHMAIVVDEFGGTSGIVTMEDILEEIVGEIFDEYDEDEKQCIRLEDGSFIVKAKILLTNFFRMTDIDPDEFGELTEEVETLGGLLLEIKGGFPQRKEIVRYENYRFQILELDSRRILKVKFWITGKEDAETKGSE